MASNNWKHQAPLFEQVNFMKNKIQLMEGDRKAYYDATFCKLTKEHEKLIKLRNQVKTLRQEINDKINPDEFITDQALQKLPIDRQALNKHPSEKAMTMMDSYVNYHMKRHNALSHMTIVRKDRLHELEEQYTQHLIHAQELEELQKRQGRIGQVVRDLENRLDKAYLKKNEADHINSTYTQIRQLLKAESVSYELTLNALEKEVKDAQVELVQVKELERDAILARNHDLVELRRHEEFITTEMKRRELELTNMRKMADKTSQHNLPKMVSRVDVSLTDNEEKSTEKETSIEIDENTEKLQKQENLFAIIKDATGISNLNQMVKRFQSQVNTEQNLTTLKLKLQEDIINKKIDKQNLMNEFLRLKFSSEEKATKYANLKQDRENKLETFVRNLNKSAQILQEKEHLMSQIRFHLEHLSLKCEKKVDRNADLIETKFYVKMLDKICNELIIYVGEMKDYNIKEELIKFKEQENEIILLPTEVNLILETQVNSFNTRVKTTQYHTKDIINDSDSESEEKVDVFTRELLKRQSRKLYDAKAKKKAIG